MLKRPGMFVPSEDCNTIAVFVIGMDIALDGKLLAGFGRWLRHRYGMDPSPLTWSADISHVFDTPGHDVINRCDADRLKLMSDLVHEFVLSK